MFRMKSLSFFVVGAVLVAGCSHSSKRTDCLERHGALDIGSGSTKAVAVVVDVCEKKIEQVLYDEQTSLGFSETAEKNKNREIPEAFLREAVGKIRPLTEKLKSLNLKTVSGVATSAFRTANNGPRFVAALSQELELPIEVISQEAEARLGYWSAVAKRPGAEHEEIVVWDIGGGSMQMIAFEGGQTHIFQGDLAAVTFKNRVLRDVLHKDPSKVSTPNPLGQKWEQALALAKAHADQNLPPYFKAKAKTARWMGIGGVLSRSIREQVGGKQVYTPADLKAALAERSAFSDQRIGGDYAATDVTNLALVAGYLEVLGLPRLESVSASLGQGWILYRLQSSPSERTSASMDRDGGAVELPPAQTGPGIVQARGPHLLREARVSTTSPKLLVTLGGTGSVPRDFGAFAEVAASVGYAVLSLDYPNMTISTVCRENPIPDCFDRFREEVVTGKDSSPHVSVDLANSILNRLRSAVFWAQEHDPRWKVFWKNGDVFWSRVVIAGHSQGSGHAAYLSKMFPFQGVILFAGPQDTWADGSVGAWVSKSGATASTRYHALLHRDDFFGSAGQIKVVEELRRQGSPLNPAKRPPLLIVSEKKGGDPHNFVLSEVFKPEWKELLFVSGSDQGGNP